MRDLVMLYFMLRGQKWPTTDQAMQWVQTELGEVYELLLGKEGGWVRNNPADHPQGDDLNEDLFKEQLAEELGDAILMLLVAGYASDVNPLEALLLKMGDKLYKEGQEKSGAIEFDPEIHTAMGIEMETGKLLYSTTPPDMRPDRRPINISSAWQTPRGHSHVFPDTEGSRLHTWRTPGGYSHTIPDTAEDSSGKVPGV